MVRVVDAQPVGFWDLFCPSAVEVVAGKGDYAVEVVDMVSEGFDCAVAMAVAEVVAEGFDCIVELCTLASGGCPGCIVSLRASLALC
jgi:hypothetical protein